MSRTAQPPRPAGRATRRPGGSPTGVETSAPEQGEPGEPSKLVEQLENKFLHLQNRFYKLRDKYYLLTVDSIKRGNPSLQLSFDALNRVEKLEARIDSGERPPSRRSPSRSTAKRREAA